jgi:hypothetical protein
MELKAYVQKAENETLLELEKRLMQARYRLEFLLDHCSLAPSEIRSNNDTFSWIDRLPNIFEEHKLIASDKTLQFQEALKVSSKFPFLYESTINLIYYNFLSNLSLSEKDSSKSSRTTRSK